MVLDEMANRLRVERERERWGGLAVRSGDLVLLKPMTFMNRSGQSVARMMRETDAEKDDLLVVMDDLDLTLGTVRMRPGGSSGGHRGLQSVIDHMGARDFSRLRLGIGPCPSAIEPRDFVLSEFTEDEKPVVHRMVQRAAEAAMCWVGDGTRVAMSRYNGPVAPSGKSGSDHETK
jgi:PTH1 family peptidyl-tRNA hydrolase